MVAEILEETSGVKMPFFWRCNTTDSLVHSCPDILSTGEGSCTTRDQHSKYWRTNELVTPLFRYSSILVTENSGGASLWGGFQGVFSAGWGFCSWGKRREEEGLAGEIRASVKKLAEQQTFIWLPVSEERSAAAIVVCWWFIQSSCWWRFGLSCRASSYFSTVILLLHIQETPQGSQAGKHA